MHINHKKIIWDSIFIITGCVLLAVSINVFLTPNKISAGGISTIGTILLHLFNIRMSITNLFFNAILFVFGYKTLGRYAVFQTAFGIIMLSVCLELTSYIPPYYENEIIAVMCGGILMGAGVGMIVKVGASTGGSDFAGLILKKFLPHISLAKLIMFIDCFIVIISGIIFKSFSVTFYSITALFVSSIIIDKIMTFGESAKMILIFSENIKELSEHILQKFERGVTGIHSLGMYSNRESLMLLCVITPKELPVYISMIKEIDKNAFVIINNVHEVLGEGFKAIDINY